MWSPNGDGMWIVGGTARVGIELGVKKGDFARICGLPGEGVLKPVCILEPLFCCTMQSQKCEAIQHIVQLDDDECHK